MTGHHLTDLSKAECIFCVCFAGNYIREVVKDSACGRGCRLGTLTYFTPVSSFLQDEPVEIDVGYQQVSQFRASHPSRQDV